MKKVGIVCAMVCMVLAACTKPKPILPKKNPEGYKQEEQPEYTGEQIYQQKCISCHGSDGKLGVAGAKDITVSTLTVDERVQLITKGKGAMPAFNATLLDEEIKKVAEYTTTLK